MKSKILFLPLVLALGACTVTSMEKKPACTGSLVKGCQPVVYFDVNEAKLTPEAKENIDWAVQKLDRFPKRHVSLTGHADPTGDVGQNLSLSEDRVEAVQDYLIDQGISEERIHVDYKGDEQPVCMDEICHELSRRVEFNIYTEKENFLY